jgi:gluconate kinase
MGPGNLRTPDDPESDIWIVLIETAERSNRSMPPTLPRSQFETLSREDEHPVAVTEHSSIAETVSELLEWLAS